MCDVKNSGIVFNTSNILNKTTTDLNEERKYLLFNMNPGYV